MIIYQNLDKPSRLKIGYLGENNATKVVFDFSRWAKEYGEGYLTVLLQRYGEDYAYPVSLEQTDHIATWLVSNIDVAIVGAAKAQAEYRVDNILAKTTTFRVEVENSLDNSGEVPEPYESILSQIVEDVHDVATNTAEVERLAPQVADDASSALDSKQKAKQSEDNAKGYAESAQESAGNASDSATSASNFADEAERQATLASISASNASDDASDAQTYSSNALTYANNASASATAAQGYAQQATAKVGDLADLTTTDKSTIVSAINELVTDLGDVETLLSAI